MRKYTIPPGHSLAIQTIAHEPAQSAFRPVTALCSVLDGQKTLEARLNIKIMPSIQVLSQPIACVNTLISKNYNAPKTVGKGTSVAVGTCAFEEFQITANDTVDFVNTTVSSPP